MANTFTGIADLEPQVSVELDSEVQTLQSDVSSGNTTSEVAKELGSFTIEPESKANEDTKPKYPYNKITQSESGHTFEMDDTPGRERVRIQHRIESFIEMHPDGSVTHKIQGDGYDITVKDKHVIVGGKCNMTITGDVNIDIQGNLTQRVKGNYDLVVEGNFTQSVTKETTFISNEDMRMIVNPTSITGTLNINTGGNLHLFGDLFASGEFVADKITSATRVDAGTGVSAGPLGFVSAFGGLSVGIPFAVPGVVYAVAAVSSSGVVNAPLGTFGVMGSVLMTDLVNTSMYDFHTHPAPRGWTGIPVPPMV
jgi:uncharacterized protein YxjI